MTPVRRLALDVLKPHEPELLEFGRRIGDLDGVAGVNVAVIEIDREVQNVNLTIEGDDLDYGAIQDAIREQGATVHSVDEVSCGERLVCESAGPPLVRPTWLR